MMQFLDHECWRRRRRRGRTAARVARRRRRMLQPTDDAGQSDDEQEQQRQEQERPPQQIIISIIILCISDNKKTDFVIQQIQKKIICVITTGSYHVSVLFLNCIQQQKTRTSISVVLVKKVYNSMARHHVDGTSNHRGVRCTCFTYTNITHITMQSLCILHTRTLSQK